MSTSSRLFEGYKSIGFVSSSVPHLVRYIEKINKIQIVTVVGRCFLVFNEKLQLIETCMFFSCYKIILLLIVCLGAAHSSDICALASDSRYLFTASNTEIFAWKYGHKWVCFILIEICFF